MSELISLQIGHFGNVIGNAFWQDLYLEHKIDFNGIPDCSESDSKLNLDAFLYQDLNGIYKPRTLLIDSDPDDLADSQIFKGHSLIESSNIIKGTHEANKNFAVGKHNKELIDQVIEKIRKLAEKSQSLQGFQFFHSIGGGTGSGTMVEIMNQAFENYTKCSIVNFVGFPSKRISDLPQESLNACLSMNTLVGNSSLCVMLDNGKYFESISRRGEFGAFDQINQIIRQHVSDFTSLLRFPSCHYSSYRKIATDFVPYQRIHFLNISSSYELDAIGNQDLMNKTLDPLNLFYQSNLHSFRTLNSIMLSRGNCEVKLDKKKFNTWVQRNEKYFVEWISSQTLHHHIETSNPYTTQSYSYIQNSLNINELFLRLSNDISGYIKDKTILARYLKHGMDEMDFVEAEEILTGICSDYFPYPETFFEEDEDEDDSRPEEEDIAFD